MTRPHLAPLLEGAGLDALVAVSLENVYWSSGVPILTQRLIPSRLAFVVWTPDDEATILVCAIEEAQVRDESWITDIRGYVEFAESPVAALAGVLREKRLGRARIGIETTYLGQRYYAELTRLLPDANIVDGDGIFDEARVIKTPDEAATLERAANATDAAIRDTFADARLGDSEAILAERMEARLRANGADGIAFTVLATGRHAHMAHPSPGPLRMESGQLLRTDFGGYFGARHAGYFSDLARTVAVGKATTTMRDTYHRLFEVHASLLEALRPGVRACDLFELARRGFEERNLTFRMPHIGHGIGLSIHEEPMLTPATATELRAGMILAIEPITVTPEGIFHVEDMVQITEGGSRLLSPGHDWAEFRTIG